MADMSFKITVDNSAEILAELEQNIALALDVCGAQAVSHTVTNLERDAYKGGVSWYRRTGHLKDFTHQVVKDEKAVYVGTNTEHAA